MTSTSLARIAHIAHPLAAVRRAAGPSPVEYAVLFLAVMAGVLTVVR